MFFQNLTKMHRGPMEMSKNEKSDQVSKMAPWPLDRQLGPPTSWGYASRSGTRSPEASIFLASALLDFVRMSQLKSYFLTFGRVLRAPQISC